VLSQAQTAATAAAAAVTAATAVTAAAATRTAPRARTAVVAHAAAADAAPAPASGKKLAFYFFLWCAPPRRFPPDGRIESVLTPYRPVLGTF